MQLRRSFHVLMSAAIVMSGMSLRGEQAKKSQSDEGIPVVKSAKTSNRTAAGDGEVVATNFVVSAGACVRADSVLDYIDSSEVSISLLAANGTDMSSTRIVPFFAVAPGAIYVAAGRIIFASDFYYIDGGGATVPVEGRFLRIRICNDASYDITYAQLTARASAR